MRTKRLKIFKSPWHIAHDHDLIEALKPYADFDLLINYTRRWDEKNRPLPDNVSWVTHFEPGKYDLAILNIDQQCADSNLNKSVLTAQMKRVIKELEPNLPIVFINHATPVYPENYPDGNKQTNYNSDLLRKAIMEIVGDSHMVVNSKQASLDWGRGYPIWHGMDSKEWIYSDKKENRSATFITYAGIGIRYYNRDFLVNVIEELKDRYGINHQWINAPGNWNAKDIKDYKEFLGKTLVYFNPTYASPMPRARTEAMLSGCCIVTTDTQDADLFIKDGYNGFLVKPNDVNYTCELIAKLLSNYNLAREIGKRGRDTALEIFNRDRYRNDWLKFLSKEVGLEIPTEYPDFKKDITILT